MAGGAARGDKSNLAPVNQELNFGQVSSAVKNLGMRKGVSWRKEDMRLGDASVPNSMAKASSLMSDSHTDFDASSFM